MVESCGQYLAALPFFSTSSSDSNSRGISPIANSIACSSPGAQKCSAVSDCRLRLSPTVSGVGQSAPPREYEDPVPDVRRTNGCRRYAVPLRIVPALGQVSEYSSEPPVRNETAEGWDVLHEDESWL